MKMGIISLLFIGSLVQAQSIEQTRTDLILKAFNAKPQDLIRPLVATDIELGRIDGRVNVNEKAKFSYFLDIQHTSDAQSRMTLIPMATSRYTPTYYQTDEFWEANKDAMAKAKADGTTGPKQDMNEVEAWLKEMKLSTNPDVIAIDPATNKIERTPLQKFLFEQYKNNYVKDGYITLFRGAEKQGEFQSWSKGEVPRGVRYWTPTANYAWRYARKNTNFLDELVAGQAPLFKFKIPVKQFEAMVMKAWPHLTLGTELTKSAHRSFDSARQFTDDLTNGQAYLGEGHYGVEFELRANRSGAAEMVQFFKGAVTIQDLVQDRTNVLKLTRHRLLEKNPENKTSIESLFDLRIKRIETEGKILSGIMNKIPAAELNKMLSEMPYGSAEITNIVGVNFNSWARNKINQMAAAEAIIINAKKASGGSKTCEGLFLGGA
jgi:hypothetical protein